MSAEHYQSFESKLVENRIAAAELLQREAEQARDAAVAELAKVKQDVGWMMKHALIADLIMNSDSIPSAREGYVEAPETDDSARIAWINRHGRTSMGRSVFIIALPHGGGDVDQEELPEAFNVRHIVDICRRRVVE